MALCLKAKRGNAEKERKKLVEKGLLDGAYVPCRDEKFVYFAVKGCPKGMELVQKRLVKREGFAKPLAAELEGRLTPDERAELVKSFDIVGDIAVIEVPGALEGKEKLIASAIMKQQHAVRVVAKKIGGTAGEFRIRPVKVVAGEKRTRTICREAGCLFELDLNRAYFTPRLGTERGRVAALVKPSERVLVPFAGVGPFAIRIAKAVPSAEVVGIELNPDAAEYFAKNIARNKLQNCKAVKGDVAALLPGKYRGWADRIAMPLPKDAAHFLDCCIPCLKKGGILHYYSFGEAPGYYAKAESDVRRAAARLGRKARVVFRRIVRPYSKGKDQVVIDAMVG
jgi:tRNA (guanine37-N1)-methyltransferase